ncbi:PaaX family transcriptional regulator C-terminal domain-containing protein [Mycobacterium sp.]|uniref:PaaX family transcriptional regulator C-terminal domain-containing protein n=1 Tax=Mycobacterium sp. TaxID=1785 RepID=UPI003A84EB35
MPDSPGRMTARSVVLSALLGAHPAWASSGELVVLAADFGIRETALRVALTRLVGSGDLIRSADGYRLSERLLERQGRQDAAMLPRTAAWCGGWNIVVVTSVGVDPRIRASIRHAMQENRFGELREGVWMRPDNLELQLCHDVAERVRVLRARDEDSAELAGKLWDLSEWTEQGRRLLDEISCTPDIPGRFAVAAAIVRHLLTDPMLPDELLPADWPGSDLRAAYLEFAAELARRLQGSPSKAGAARNDNAELQEAR